jgi:hypothetical protein
MDQFDPSRRRRHGVVEPAALEFGQAQAVGVTPDLRERQPIRPFAEAIAPRPDPNAEICEALWSTAIEPRHDRLGVQAAERVVG